MLYKPDTEDKTDSQSNVNYILTNALNYLVSQLF